MSRANSNPFFGTDAYYRFNQEVTETFGDLDQLAHSIISDSNPLAGSYAAQPAETAVEGVSNLVPFPHVSDQQLGVAFPERQAAVNVLHEYAPGSAHNYLSNRYGHQQALQTNSAADPNLFDQAYPDGAFGNFGERAPVQSSITPGATSSASLFTPCSPTHNTDDNTQPTGSATSTETFSSTMSAPSRTRSARQLLSQPATASTGPLQSVQGGSTALHHSRARKANNNYGDDLNGRATANTRFPLNIQLGAIEILSIFPAYLVHPDVVIRLFKAGWKRKDIGKAQLHAVNLLEWDRLETVKSRIQHQIGDAVKLRLNLPRGTRVHLPTHLGQIAISNDLTANAWQTREQIDPTRQQKGACEDFKLADLAAPLIQAGTMPKGQDRLQFTECLEYAAAHPNLNLTTADCGLIIQQQGFVGQGTLDSTHDEAALTRFRQAVRDPPKPRQ